MNPYFPTRQTIFKNRDTTLKFEPIPKVIQSTGIDFFSFNISCQILQPWFSWRWTYSKKSCVRRSDCQQYWWHEMWGTYGNRLMTSLSTSPTYLPVQCFWRSCTVSKDRILARALATHIKENIFSLVDIFISIRSDYIQSSRLLYMYCPCNMVFFISVCR